MSINPQLLQLQKNLALKQIFFNRGLDLEAVMEFTPHDLELENARLQSLADFVMEYDRYGSQRTMELIKGEWVFPPIFPDISPESDWLRFERWIRGEPLWEKLADKVSGMGAPFQVPENVPEHEIEAESKRLFQAIEKAGICIGLREGLPPRLLYTYLHEELNEEFDLYDGSWHIDGCSGYCPGCIQRPWCETGQNSCWSEDEEVGKMHLTEGLAPYVSASPQSLELLKKAQAEEDAAYAKIKHAHPHPYFEDETQPGEDWLTQQN